MKTILLSVGLLTVPALTAQAQVFVQEAFNYANDAELAANWTISASPITLNTGAGNPAPSVNNAGTATAANIWKGSTFSLTPTDAAPIRLTADLFSPAVTTGAVTTVGLRTGANPLYEMGLYRQFDNIQTGPDSSAVLSPVGTGIGTRTINLGIDLNGQDWVKMDDYFTGGARFEATFTTFGVTTRIDLGIDGTWDLSFTEMGNTPTGAFSELRIHAPVTTAAGSGGTGVDNLRLEVIPEPSSFLLLGLGTGLAFARRRR